MIFKRIEPVGSLKEFVECIWIIESTDTTPTVQKIIPDGFAEIIFHFGDRYRIKIGNRWQVQGRSLLAGQIKKYFFLENTGRSGVLGIKCKPAAVTHLFCIEMDLLADKVVPLSSIRSRKLQQLGKNINFSDHKTMAATTQKYLLEMLAAKDQYEPVIDEAIRLVFSSNGTMSVKDICKSLFITERRLQRLFKKYIGIPPKAWSRIIRFNYLFELIKHGKTSWPDITYLSGYFDQSHFIRDFKAFTGEEPSNYFFDEENLANFFLRKK